MKLDKADIDKVLSHMDLMGTYTTQEITEWMYCCKKGDKTYNENVDYVGRIMQYLKRRECVQSWREETGHGYSICKWCRL